MQCPIHLFRAETKTLGPDGVEFEDTREAWGWAECTSVEVVEVMVPGTPLVKILADKLDQFLS